MSKLQERLCQKGELGPDQLTDQTVVFKSQTGFDVLVPARRG